jgi:pyridoxamine 5'-phosphate oxidase
MDIPQSPLHNIRKEYVHGSLDIQDVNPLPLLQLQAWLAEALQAEMLEPTAIHLSTVASNGHPSGRIVLLKNIDHGLVFFTNYASRKGHQIAENSHVAATLFWDKMERQIRIEGKVEKISVADSETYFHSRPYKSQLGALVSPQSQVIPSRESLELALQEAEKQYPEGSLIPKPESWGGYRILPDYFEFWQGKRSRLHDRIIYSLQEDQSWKIERLAP